MVEDEVTVNEIIVLGVRNIILYSIVWVMNCKAF
jgi:hypothetical protein